MAKQQSIFDQQGDEYRRKNAPLASRMRPMTLSEFVGQDELLAEGRILHTIISTDQVPSMIFWGPPGSGKTTLARIIANKTGSTFVSFSAVISGIKEIKDVIDQARRDVDYYGKQTILFIDEIHRFNKAQQDAFLPHIEDGAIIFIGATTENPSFQVNSPLLSRVKVFVLKALSVDNLTEVCLRALGDSEHGLAHLKPHVERNLLQRISTLADGDARSALNILELAVLATKPNEQGTREVTADKVADILQRNILYYDRHDEEHFNLISAMHKSLRGSDVQASCYWLMRMIRSGEDPRYVGRRMVRFASEDVGMADPFALPQTIAALEAYERLGPPEGILALLQAVVYLATAPKSNALYLAEKRLHREIEESGSLPVPMQIRNAPTGLMKELGYGKDYQYAHELPDAIDTLECLPDNVQLRDYYRPTGYGLEGEITARMQRRNEIRARKKSSEPPLEEPGPERPEKRT